MVPVGARLAELARLRLQYDESRRSVQVKPVLKCKQSCRLQIINRFDKTTQLRSRTYLFLLSVYMFGSRGMHWGSKFMISCLHIDSSHGMNCGSEHFLSTYWFSRHALWFRTFPVYILVLEACTVVQNSWFPAYIVVLEAYTVVQNSWFPAYILVSRHALWFRTFPVYILVLMAWTVVQNISCLHIGSRGMHCGSKFMIFCLHIGSLDRSWGSSNSSVYLTAFINGLNKCHMLWITDKCLHRPDSQQYSWNLCLFVSAADISKSLAKNP